MSVPITYPSKLSIHRLTFDVLLGYSKTERHTPQPVALDLDVFFSAMPQACFTDGAGFLCYDKLAVLVQEAVKGKEFSLIEHLALVCGGAVDVWVTKEGKNAEVDQVHYTLSLHKCNVPIDAMKGGASFTYTTLPNGLINING